MLTDDSVVKFCFEHGFIIWFRLDACKLRGLRRGIKAGRCVVERDVCACTFWSCRNAELEKKTREL